MKRLKRFFRPAPLWRALLECLILGLLLVGLIRLVETSSPNESMFNVIISILVILAFWMALRLRLPKGKWGRKLGYEALATVLIVILVVLLIPTLLLMVDISPLQSTTGGNYTLLAFSTGLIYPVLRGLVLVWYWWQRKRKQRLIWDLMHIQLSLVVLVALALISLGGIYVLVSSQNLYIRDGATPLVRVILQLAYTVFPYLGITLAIALVALVVMLPPAALISYQSVQRFTRRLDHLADTTRRLRQGDYTARAQVQGEDEIARLQQDFNAMAADLETAMTALGEERDKVALLLDARRQLTANASHELRTPVATIQSYLENLSGAPDLTPEAQSDLAIVQNEVQHLTRLIDDLFTLSRAEVGALEIKSQPVALSTLARQVAGAFRPLAWQVGKVTIVAESETDPLIQADPDRLEQVLANLFRNAIQHTPPGGIISLLIETQDEQAVITVRDTGEGIPSEELPHIWERFYRGENAENAASRGAGLGLALVKEFVTAMGGQIEVSSEPGLGTEFIICFNLLQGDHRETSSQQV
ncbi:HAMP domain-containing histidine kinase [bacterium]|nr:HAMP domain-containing histidine kinase [bacterium]